MYDAIIVGARCAGSPTALLLARRGYKVLLLDRATFPSDMPLSTHYVHQTGTARLKRWGLLDKLAASNCPPITRNYFDYGAFTLTGSPPPAEGVQEAYAPRRKALDPILVEAAAAAGAELRQGFSVQELVCGPVPSPWPRSPRARGCRRPGPCPSVNGPGPRSRAIQITGRPAPATA